MALQRLRQALSELPVTILDNVIVLAADPREIVDDIHSWGMFLKLIPFFSPDGHNGFVAKLEKLQAQMPSKKTVWSGD